MRLLKTSILEDGWTQPLVVNPDNTIVDGFHRWTLAADKEIAALTGGLVPVVYLHGKTEGEKRMATIRHNRARGTHGVLQMSAIVEDMLGEGLSVLEIMKQLGMEREEVERLANQAGILEFIEGGFSRAE